MIDLPKGVIKKNIESSLEKYRNFKSEQSFHVRTNVDFLEGTMANVKLNNDKFEIKILSDRTPQTKLEKPINKFELEKASVTYILEEGASHNFTLTVPDPYIYKFTSTKISKKLNGSKKYFRLVIPTENKESLSPLHVERIYMNPIMYYGLYSFRLNAHDFQLYKYSNKDRNENFLIIDSSTKQSFEDFKSDINVILLALAVLSGNLYHDKHIFLDSEEFNDDHKYNVCEYSVIGKSKITNQEITDPHGFRSYCEHLEKEGIIAKAEDTLKRVDMFVKNTTFTLMCDRIQNDGKIERIINLILDGTMSESLILRSAIYSVALETLSAEALKTRIGKTNPIKDKAKSIKFIDKIKFVIDEFKQAMDESSYKAFIKKAQNFNKPLNADKLISAFEHYKIPLNDDDIKKLKMRNVFLHGSTPIKNHNTSKNKMQELELITKKLKLLLNCLLLRHLNYRGHVRNHYAFGKANKKVKVKEHFYKII